MYEKHSSYLPAAYLTLENHPHYKIFISLYRHKLLEIARLAKGSSGENTKILNTMLQHKQKSAKKFPIYTVLTPVKNNYKVRAQTTH